MLLNATELGQLTRAVRALDSAIATAKVGRNFEVQSLVIEYWRGDIKLTKKWDGFNIEVQTV